MVILIQQVWGRAWGAWDSEFLTVPQRMLIWESLLSNKDLEDKGGVYLKCTEEHLTEMHWVTIDVEVGIVFPYFSDYLRESMVLAERFHPLRKVTFYRHKYKDNISPQTVSNSHYLLSLPTPVL